MLEAASSYPLANAFWTMLEFFAFVIWIWLLFTIFGDLFRRSDISGWTMAAWTVFVIVVPFIGVFTYLVTQNKGMNDRRIESEKQAQSQFDAYVRSVNPPSQDGATAEIGRAKQLLDDGAITDEEYASIKRKALAP